VYDTANRFVDGANVEILTGPYAGMQVTTNADGEFSFSGRFVDLVAIRASRDGYRAQTQTSWPNLLTRETALWRSRYLQVYITNIAEKDRRRERVCRGCICCG
jgi:hypothetical protein